MWHAWRRPYIHRGSGNLRERDRLKGSGIRGGQFYVELIVKKWDGCGTWTGLIWLRIRTSEGRLL